jgi:hypothetical protein
MGDPPEFKSEFMRRYSRVPWIQIAGIACFVYLAAKDAGRAHWVWFAIWTALVVISTVNVVAIGRGWRPPWMKKPPASST